jgi:FkbM family methyltransferase
LVIDVGANKGQFAVYARIHWPKAQLNCFEPPPELRAKRQQVIGGQAQIYDCALGAKPGKGRMHLATRTDSSPLLAVGARQTAIFGMESSGDVQVLTHQTSRCLRTDTAAPVRVARFFSVYCLAPTLSANRQREP